jgi:hypothetical protein
LVLLGEVFGSEHFVRAAGFKQETAAGNLSVGNSCGCSHVLILEIRDAERVENPQKKYNSF